MMEKDKAEHSHLEEEFLKRTRKETKVQRKMISAKDRSKFKKTDREKYFKSVAEEREAKLAKHQLLEGRVISINPQAIIVDWNGLRINCILKGLLKKEKMQLKNLVTVGDFVLFEKKSESEGVIAQIKPRETALSRADNLSRRKEQLIAANVEQVLITASVVNPPLKPSLIDRYIIATRKGGMDPIVVINKIDLFQNPPQDEDPDLIEREKMIYDELLEAYESAGIPVIVLSSFTKEGIDQLRQVMRNKTSVFSGQSGVGKSSLINCLTGLNLRVREIVEKTKKGAHTTSVAQLLPLDFGGWCVDTPGVKSFGIWDLKKDEIEGYFDEIRSLKMGCKFQDCTHTHEEQCAVLRALEKGELSPLRYESYQALMESVSKEHLRR